MKRKLSLSTLNSSEHLLNKTKAKPSCAACYCVHL